MSRHFRHDNTTLGAFEARDQADLALRSSHTIPGHPKAIGVAEARFAVMFREILDAKNVLSRRKGVLLHVSGIVVREYDQLAVDLDRFLVVVPIEHDAPTKTRNSALHQHGICP